MTDIRPLALLIALMCTLHSPGADLSGHYQVPGIVADTIIGYDLPRFDTGGRLSVTPRAAIMKQSARWSLKLISPGDTVTVTFQAERSSKHDVFDTDRAYVTIAGPDQSRLSVATVPAMSADNRTFNSLRVTLDADSLMIMGGHRQLRHVTTLPYRNRPLPARLELVAAGRIDFSELSVSFEEDKQEKFATAWTPESIARHLGNPSVTSPQGYWEYLDRNTSPRKARSGGRYRLAIVESPDRKGTYDIIYLDGAEVYKSMWTPGMRKGRLIPTDYQDHYDLQWIDSTFNLHSADAYADIDSESVMTLRFPRLDSSLRFTLKE